MLIKQKNQTAARAIPNIKTVPWEHQAAAYWFAREKGSCLINYGMGSGKTKIIVDLVCTRELGMKRVLVTCPKAVVPHWMDDFEEHAGTSVDVCLLARFKEGERTPMQCSVKRKLEMAKAVMTDRINTTPTVLVVNHESLWRDPLGSWALKQPWNLVVCDESHRAKSPGGKFSFFLRTLARRAERRICLTGTPMPHSPLDIYGQARFIDTKYFGSSNARFKGRYAVMGGFENHQVIGYQNRDEFSRVMDEFTITVKSEDVLDLPPVQHIVKRCKLSPAERKIYTKMEKDMIVELEEGDVVAGIMLTKILRLSQIANGATKTDEGKVVRTGDAKEKLLADTLECIDPSERAVVFCRFHSDLDIIHAVSKKLDRNSVELSGRVNQLGIWERDDFRGIIAVQIQAGGTGVDSLKLSKYGIYYNIGYSMGEYDQSLARLHRPGQERSVVYYHLVAENTTDETIYEALDAKRDVVDAVLDSLTRRG